VLIPASNRRRILSIALFVLVLVLAGAAGWWFFGRQVGSDGPEVGDLELIPADAEGFATIRLAELWANPAVQAARQRGVQGEDLGTRLERETGLRPEQLERVHIVSVDGNWRHGWIVGRTLGPIDRAGLLAKLESRRAARHAGRRYHIGTTDGQERAVHFAGPRVLVVATEEGMKGCLDQASRPVRTGPLLPLLALAEGNSQVVAGLNVNTAAAERLRGNPILQPLAKARTAQATLDVDRDALLDVRATFPDDKAAKAALELLDGLKEQAPAALLLLRLGGRIDATTNTQLNKLLESLKTEVKGNEVAVKAKTDPGTVAGILLTGSQALKR
jgi:hypothetical protein